MQKTHSLIVFLLLAGVILLSQSAFIVTQGYQAMVLQFGDPKATYTEPGLKWKTPFIQQVLIFPKMVLGVDPQPEEVILADQKRLVVDTFGRYRIKDMLAFNNKVGSTEQAELRLNNIINSMTREVLGTATLSGDNGVLSPKRADFMLKIREQSNLAVKDMGIEIVDVRIGRADLPDQTSAAIYDRMKSERQREAAQFRAEGQQISQETKSNAENQRTLLLADAEKQAQILRGEGDAEATKIYAEAYSRDPEFYAFYRSLQAYREALPGDNTTMILAPDSDFFRFFKDEQGKK
ncbi:MAG: protease modulator HflC [Micavibrio sp.]|nr:protease modulator HflC [Micavibrio sp.]